MELKLIELKKSSNYTLQLVNRLLKRLVEQYQSQILDHSLN
jgi:hypothetical protein